MNSQFCHHTHQQEASTASSSIDAVISFPSKVFKTVTPLRAYQQRFSDEALLDNRIVVLPTGSGKTLIAAAVALRMKSEAHFTSAGNSPKTLFLVPTCILVAQQAAALRTETGMAVAEFMGGLAQPKTVSFDVLVSTPAALVKLCELGRDSFGLSLFHLVIFDEVHHVIKRHPYRTLARKLMAQPHRPRILGLTASLTYAVHAARIKSAMNDLCSELGMRIDQIVTASQQELQADGYHAASIAADVRVDATAMSSSFPSSSCSSVVDVDLPQSDDSTLSSLEIPGPVHETRESFLKCVEKREAPAHPLTLELMDTIRCVEAELRQLDKGFRSPVWETKQNTGEWSAYAHKQAMKQRDMRASLRYMQLSHLYEAARLLVNSRQLNLELAFQYLIMTDILQPYLADVSASEEKQELHVHSEPSFASLQQCWNMYCSDFYRLQQLKEVVMEQSFRFADTGTPLRCIIFVQQRVSTHILQHFFSQDEDLAAFQTGIMYATKTEATPTLSISRTEVKETISKFSGGQVQILIATAVAEEGMDVPAANCVIRFDLIQTPVSLVQSRGRARQADSAFVVLQQRTDRTLQTLEQAEREQQAVIHACRASPASEVERDAKLRQSFLSRKRNAQAILTRYSQNPKDAAGNAVSTLNSYSQKMAGEVVQACEATAGKCWKMKFSLLTPGAVEVNGEGTASSKRDASCVAANQILRKLIDGCWN